VWNPIKRWTWDKTLHHLECVTVFVISIVIYAAIFYEVIWIVSATSGQHQDRFRQTFQLLNDNWRAGLLLFVLLFYRTVRKFMERVEKFAGMTATKPEHEETDVNPAGEAQ
jgi:hypothetical protein